MNLPQEEELRKIWRLIYGTLRQIQIEDNFDKALEKEKNLTYQDKPDNFFFRRMVDLVFQSGVRGVIWKRYESAIRKEFKEYDVKKVAKFKEKDVERMMANPKMFKHRKKIQAVVYNAKEIMETSKRYGDFWKFIDNNTIDDLVKKIKEWFKHLNYVNTYAFLRYVGVNVLKPDINMRRILWRLGFIEDTKINQENIDKIQEVGKRMAEAVGKNVKVVDYVIYMYGAGETPYVKHSICGNVPKCEECKLKEFCRYENP